MDRFSWKLAYTLWPMTSETRAVFFEHFLWQKTNAMNAYSCWLVPFLNNFISRAVNGRQLCLTEFISNTESFPRVLLLEAPGSRLCSDNTWTMAVTRLDFCGHCLLNLSLKTASNIRDTPGLEPRSNDGAAHCSPWVHRGQVTSDVARLSAADIDISKHSLRREKCELTSPLSQTKVCEGNEPATRSTGLIRQRYTFFAHL
jgi:hypothetical protein